MNNHLSKWFVIIEHNSRKLSSFLNYAKLRIRAINQLETDDIMAKNTEISSVANIIKKVHIQSDLYLIYKQKLYHAKERGNQ